MIPTAFVTLDELPLTPNDKIDYQALPTPDLARLGADTAFVAPHTPLERTLADIWAEVLGLGQVGVHDHFLALGGNSILSMQIVARALDRWQVAIPPDALLKTPTVADLAIYITQAQAATLDEEEANRLLEDITGLSGDKSHAC